MYKARVRGQQKEFVELFSINKEEEDILKAFRQNDQELEEIASTIVEELKKVKMNAENIEAGIDE